MVRSETPQHTSDDQSLGDLVALAAKDVSQLVRYEIDLAKSELRGDLRRVGLAGALGGVAAFVGCLVLVLLCFAYAYGLITLGIWDWAAFLIVAGTCVLLAAVAVGVALLMVRHLSGMRETRKSVTEGISLLRRDGQRTEGIPAGDGGRPEISGDGRTPEIAAGEPR